MTNSDCVIGVDTANDKFKRNPVFLAFLSVILGVCEYSLLAPIISMVGEEFLRLSTVFFCVSAYCQRETP